MATQYRVVGKFRCSETYHTIGEIDYKTKVDALRALEKFQIEYGADNGSDYDVIDMHVVKREITPWERL